MRVQIIFGDKVFMFMIDMFAWYVPVFLVVMSVIALFAGTLPSNEYKPRGDLLRWIFWPATVIYFIIVFFRGMTV